MQYKDLLMPKIFSDFTIGGFDDAQSVLVENTNDVIKGVICGKNDVDSVVDLINSGRLDSCFVRVVPDFPRDAWIAWNNKAVVFNPGA